MRFTISTETPTGFVEVPADQFAAPAFRIDWKLTEQLYREAYERARAELRPSIIDRLAPSWN
jgi:hypothetical protein